MQNSRAMICHRYQVASCLNISYDTRL
jgi:hypothetical protein